MSCNVVNPGCHKHLPFGDCAPPIMSQDCTTYLKNIDCCMSQFVTGKTMKECWSKLQVLLLYPSIFQQFLYRVSPVVRRLWWCSHQTLGPTLRSWVERVISETFCSLTAKFCSLSGFVGFFWCFFAVQIWRDSETKRMVLAFFNWTTYWKHLCSQGVAGWFTRTGASSGPISVVLWLPLSKIQVLGRGSVACTECWSLMNKHPMKISIPKIVVNQHHWFPIFFMWLWGFEWFEGPDFLLRIATLRSPSSGRNSQDGSFAGDIVAWNWRFHHLS